MLVSGVVLLHAKARPYTAAEAFQPGTGWKPDFLFTYLENWLWS
jgi:hypothetical protein